MAPAIPPRPVLEDNCSCVWPAEYKRATKIVDDILLRERQTHSYGAPLAALAAVPGAAAELVASNLPSILGGSGNSHNHNHGHSKSGSMPGSLGGYSSVDTPGVTLETDRRFGYMEGSTGNGGSTSHGTESQSKPVHYGNTAVNATLDEKDDHKPYITSAGKQIAAMRQDNLLLEKDEREESDRRMNQKQSKIATGRQSLMKKREPPGRALRGYFRLSSEVKLKDLLAYREDLVVLLRTLIPEYQQSETQPIFALSATRLCLHCGSILASSLYHSAARLNTYVQEGATRGFLTLIDDAVASLESGVRMETISHREIEGILRGELATTEWRMAVKLAKMHRKNRIADLFPMKIGQFAELTVNPAEQPVQEESLLKKGAKAAVSWSGILGSSQPHSQLKAAAKVKSLAG